MAHARKPTASRCFPSLPLRLPRSVLAGALWLALPASAVPAELDYQLGLSLLRSDNIALASFDEKSETVVSPNARFEFQQRGPRVNANARGSVSYLEYLSNTFDNDVRGELVGEMTWNVVPQRVDFVVNDYLNRQPVDVLTSFNPGNEQEVNVFIAGPTFHVRPRAGTRGQLDLRYANSYAEDNKDFNGDHYNAAARLVRDTSATRSVSLNLETTRSEYRDNENDYTRSDAYVGYALALASLELTATAGYSQLRLERDGTLGEPMASLGAGWTPTPRSRLAAVARTGFSNAVQDVVNRSTDLSGSILNEMSSNDVLVGPSAVRQHEAYLAYHFTGERVGFHVQPYYQRSRLATDDAADPADPTDPDADLLATRTNYGALVSVDYEVSPRSTVTVLLAHDVNRYAALDRKDLGYVAALAFANRMSRHWSWRANLQHRRRNSAVAGASYDENSVVLSIAYLR
ncbi:outer membrane beta-barrel protein [Lysobacter sp. H21R4]|uniref:outer membrane beta-barrel protein n=1 Tax=Lysobacter sp. H21R4 TaxID=2781021 RepID=UPI0018875D73|nr:outer membrane beta-barrel protein [Lysobacter sp. H21R4]QOY61976.1 outer membrane beta-barrel protein [Lysobacter sp. H21R4]